MIIVTATDNNCDIKQVKCGAGTDTSKKDALQPQNITSYVYNGHNKTNKVNKLKIIDIDDQKYLVVLRENSALEIFQWEAEAVLFFFCKKLLLPSTGTFVSVGVHQKKFFYTCSSEGDVCIILMDDLFTDLSAQDFDDDEENLDSKVENGTTFVKRVIPEVEEDKFEELLSFKIKGPVSVLSGNEEKLGIFAFGGKENDLKLFTIKDQLEAFASAKSVKKIDSSVKLIYQAKNVKHDRLNLRVPIWITGAEFLKDERPDDYTVLTSTNYGQCRKYDTGHGRKPIYDYKVSDHGLLTLLVNFNGQEVVVSDNHNSLYKVDINKSRLLGKFQTIMGAVVSSELATVNGDQVVISGSLDRYLRVFNYEDREQIAKVFLNCKISSVAILPEESLEEKKAKKRQLEEDEEDDIWETLENNSKKPKNQ